MRLHYSQPMRSLLLAIGIFLSSLSLYAGPSSQALEDLTLIGMARTPPLADVSQTLQSAALLSKTQNEKFMVLMHLFLGRLGFPHFEVFSKFEDTGTFSFKDSSGNLYTLGMLRFDEERLKEDPKLEEIYQGLFAQMGLLAKAYNGYELIARDPRILEYFCDEARFKRLRRILRHQPHRYDIELTAFSGAFAGSLESFRAGLFQLIDETVPGEEEEDYTEVISGLLQVLFEEAREMEAFHVGLSLDELDTKLGLMTKVNSDSNLGTYIKQPVPDSLAHPERYLEPDILSFIGRWNTRAYNAYEDSLLERLEAYMPASKRFLWSRLSSSLGDFRQALLGVWAGTLGLNYEQLSNHLLLGASAKEAMDLISSQYIYSTAGLQASTTASLIQFVADTLIPELKQAALVAMKTPEATLRPFSFQGFSFGLPLFDLKFEKDKDLYLERPIHTLSFRIYDSMRPSTLLLEDTEYLGVLAQGIVSTSHEEDLRPLMERVKRNQAVADSLEPLFTYNMRRLFDLQVDIQQLYTDLLKRSPLLATGPYALEDTKRKAFIEQIQNAGILNPLRLHIETQYTLVDIQAHMDTPSLQTLLNLTEAYMQAL